MNRENIHAWHFDSNIMDFYTILNIKIDKYEKLKDEIEKFSLGILDELQLILDKAEVSLEKHFIIKLINKI